MSFGLGYGDQYCDFVTMDADNVFRCYEIKISKSDFNSNAKLSFLGDYNYFVLTEELYKDVKEGIPWWIGVYVFRNGRCHCEKKASKNKITIGQRIDLMHGMIRSLSRLQTRQIKTCKPKDGDDNG